MPDVAELRGRRAVGVVLLREPPDVVVSGDRVVAGADPDLVVERAGRVAPHPLQPVDAEPALALEVRAWGAAAQQVREPARAGEQHVDGVARRLDELQVVARVPPASGGVDAPAERVEVALEVAVRVDCRRRVGHRAPVVQMRGRAPQRRGHVVRAVPLVPVEGERVREGSRVELRRGRDAKRGRGGARTALHGDRVRARLPDGSEVERVDEREATAPPSAAVPDAAA